MKRMLLLSAALLVLAGQSADAATVFGNITLNITGTFRTQVTQGGNVSCSASALLMPDSKGGMTLSSLSATLVLNSGIQTKAMGGTVASTGKSFTCQVTTPYNYTNFATGQQIVVFYTVEGRDNGYFNYQTNQYIQGTHPLSIRQLLTLPSLPKNGQTVTENIAV